jgi:peptidoglycan/LPS O-acetylase OafA/YrhL
VTSNERATSAPAGSRDRFLDLLRMISVLRVVALHTCTKPPVVYLPWIQWIFPGMPEVFFVSGAVTAAQLRKRGARGVIPGRLRRLLPPFYVYATVAFVVMLATDLRSADPKASVDRGDLLSFLVPVVRPTGSVTREVLWGHLWFLTAFLWSIAAAPFTLALYRRVKLGALLLPLGLFAVAVAAGKFGWFPVRSEYYDVPLFGSFFVLGYAYDDGLIQRLSARTHAGIGVMLGVVGWMVAEHIDPVWKKPVAELYSSPTAHLLIGAAWMFGAFALRAPVRAWLDARPNAKVLDTVNRRNYTIFLWGPAANAVAMAASRKVGGAQGNLPLYLAVTALLLVPFVALFGMVEDLAAKRRPQLVPWQRGPGRVGSEPTVVL